MSQLLEAVQEAHTGRPEILLMEDETNVAKGLQMVLEEEGYHVDLATTGRGALSTFDRKNVDLLVADLRLPDMDGMDVIKQVKKDRPETEVIVITGYGTVDSAVEAMKSGVKDYLSKPFTDDEFKATVQGVIQDKGKVFTRDRPADLGEPEKLIRKDEVIKALRRASEPADSASDFIGFRSAASRIYGLAERLKAIMEEEKREQGAKPGEGLLFPTDAGGTADRSVPGHEGEKAGMAGAEDGADLLSRLLENSIEGIMTCDRDGTILHINKRLEQMLGYARDEVCGSMSFSRFMPIGGEERFRADLLSEEYGGENRLLLYEMHLLDKAGSRVPVQASAAVDPDWGKESGMVILFRDLAELRRVEQTLADQNKLLQQHKMMSLGRLAASVVHEINNPLAGILNYLRLMAKIIARGKVSPEKMEKFQSYLGIVENETDRCSKIVSNLLAFSRKSKEEVRKVSVREVVEKSVLLSQHKMALANIRLQTEFEEHLPVVLGDFNQIQQCVINLIFNAIDAMPEGGALTIACRSLEGEGILEIQVADSGTGISKQDLPHIFDAFYTTKTEGSGLGLGLATVYGIIERHKGSIDVESEPGKGTTFTIRLPALGKGDNANEAA